MAPNVDVTASLPYATLLYRCDEKDKNAGEGGSSGTSHAPPWGRRAPPLRLVVFPLTLYHAPPLHPIKGEEYAI
jgi:hypothetical protein